MNERIIRMSVAFTFALLCVGCEGTGPNTQRGAVAGGALGALAGAIIGNNSGNHNALAGAAIGATAGAIAGGTLGNAADHENGTIYGSQETQAVKSQPSQPGVALVTSGPPSIVEHGIEVTVKDCRLINKPDRLWLVLTLGVRNLQPDTLVTLSGNNTRYYDDRGNTFYADQLRLGNQDVSKFSWSTSLLVSGVPVDCVISFPAATADVAEISRFDMNVGLAKERGFVLTLRNILVTR